MRFFITGATGFIGQHLCQRLVAQGHSIVALVRHPDKALKLPHTNVELIKGDLSTFKDSSFTLPECDQVIHLAGTVTAKKISEYEENNYLSVIDLYDCLLRQNFRPKRFLFASSLAACGPSSADFALDEHDEPTPIDPYGKAKLMAEMFLTKQNEFPVTVFRPSMVIGPLDTNVLNLYQIAKTGFGFLPAGKRQKISFISVFDVVDAIEKLTTDASQEHRTYFLAHDEIIDTHGLWTEVARSLGKNIRIIPVPQTLLFLAMHANTAYARLLRKPNVFDRKYYDQVRADAWVCSSKKLQRDFDWKPKDSLAQIVDQTTKSYLNAGWLKVS